MAIPNIRIPGLKGGVPSGYLIGRIDPGTGEAQLISIADLVRQIRAGVDIDAGLPDTGVTPGTYGDATNVGQFTVDAKGRITAAADVAISGGGGGSGALELIDEVITSGSQTSVPFTSIAATWRDLEVHIRGRGTTAAVNVDVQARYNGDTGSNYNTELLDAQNGSINGIPLSETVVRFGVLPAASATADFSGLIIATIGDYRGTTFHKASLGFTSTMWDTGNKFFRAAAGHWRDTSAITRVDVLLSAGGFVDGTVVSLYGRM